MPAYTTFPTKLAPVLDRILGEIGIRERVNLKWKQFTPGEQWLDKSHSKNS